MEYYSVTEKKEILPFATKWVNFMLSEINRTESLHDFT